MSGDVVVFVGPLSWRCVASRVWCVRACVCVLVCVRVRLCAGQAEGKTNLSMVRRALFNTFKIRFRLGSFVRSFDAVVVVVRV